MNGRLYDPMLHRFLMPDNFVQDPYSSLSYNRYSYVLNNPLMYTDPSGEIANCPECYENPENPGRIELGPGEQELIDNYLEHLVNEITRAQYNRWFEGAIGKPVENWVNKHIKGPVDDFFDWVHGRNGAGDGPAPPIYTASLPVSPGSGGPNNLPIFGTSSAGGLGIPGGDLLRTGADFVPFVGSGLDIYEGIRDGDGWQVAMGAGFLVLDVATLGSSSLVKGAVKTGIKAGGRSLAKGGSKYLYHYTSEAAAQNISKTGLRTGKDGFLYLTNKGGLSPLQAQIELALPANRALTTSILRIDSSGLSPSIIRRVQGNLPGMGAGGGTEFLFNQYIPANLIKIFK
jgi:hypothetical protein